MADAATTGIARRDPGRNTPNQDKAADDQLVFTADDIRAAGERLFTAAGVPAEDAQLLVDVHVDADLRGEESHGARMFDVHLSRIRAGGDRPKPKVTKLADQGGMALFDAHHSIGQVVAARAMRLAIEKARLHGIGIVGVRNANSCTSLKYYPLMAAAEGMIGIATTNTLPMMPPHGGSEARVGNNPYAFVAPAGEEYPIVLDMACTAAAVERVRQAAAEGKPIPTDWALGFDGNPTRDPKEALEKYVFLPFGGYKAFGLGVAHEIMTGVLMGGGLFTRPGNGFRPFNNVYNCCQYFEAIRIDWFIPLESFKERMDEVIRTIRKTQLRPGFDEVSLPGERGWLEMERRREGGIPLHRTTVEAMRRWADDLKVAPLQ